VPHRAVEHEPPKGFPEAVRKLRWLRGTYLDQMVVLEGIVDGYLFDYLAPPEQHRLLFYGSILTRMTLQQKVQMMCKVIEHSGLRSEFPDLQARLRALVAFRNRCAHAHIQPTGDRDGGYTSAEGVFVEWKKGQLRRTAISEAEFGERLEDIPAVLHDLWRFGCRVATLRESGMDITDPRRDCDE
jgi:hypothetical protein